MAEGALLGTYGYAPISSRPNGEARGVSAVTVVHGSAGSSTTSPSTPETVARAVAMAREWVNIPANLLYPDSFAGQVRQLVPDTRVGVDVLDEEALARDGYGGLLAVGGGSSRPPRLVRLSYRPRGAKFHLALVGKGITFDTGGLNLKPAEGMYTMKCDMAGAAAVLAATWAIAQLGLKIDVTAYGALAENMPSSTAYRPSDVLTIYGGKTVENGNSDAEGRLVMADALARSAEDQPDLVVDVATLTGACVVALGERTAGVMSNDEDDRRPGAGRGRGRRRGVLAAAHPRRDPAQAGLQGGRPPLGRRRPLGRRPGGGGVPARVRARGHPLGPPGHRRPGLPRASPTATSAPAAPASASAP